MDHFSGFRCLLNLVAFKVYRFHRPANVSNASAFLRVGVHTPAFSGKLGLGDLLKKGGGAMLPQVVRKVFAGEPETIAEGLVMVGRVHNH